MRSSKLDRTLVIQRRTVTLDEYGVEVETWEPLMTIRGELVTSLNAERLGEYGVVVEPDFTFRTRYFPEITLDNRIDYKADPDPIFSILQISEIPRRKGLTIRCGVRGS